MGDDASALRRLLDVVGQLGAERRSEQVLGSILDGARDLAGARYAAVGVPDGDGGFALFLTAGVDTETWDRIGSLPRTHGLLGALLKEPEVIRRADIRADPRFRYYPHAHPDMRSFLGVPIMAGGEVVAALYLAEKIGGIPSPRPISAWWKRSPDTLRWPWSTPSARKGSRTVHMDERTRIARDLHDSVTQTLFSRTPRHGIRGHRGRCRIPGVRPSDRVRELSRTALDELRVLVDTLRPPDVDREELGAALRKRVDLLRAVHDVPILLEVQGRVGATPGRSGARCSRWPTRRSATPCSTRHRTGSGCG